METARAVEPIEDARETIVAALNTVLRSASKVEARLTGPRSSVECPSLPRYRTEVAFLAGNFPARAESEPDPVLTRSRHQARVAASARTAALRAYSKPSLNSGRSNAGPPWNRMRPLS